MQYDFNLSANGGQVIDVKGRFVKYRSGTGPIRVRLSKGGYADLMPGQGIFDTAFDSLTVNDRTGAQNIGVILAGDFDFRDDRITGTVDVVDGGRARTIQGHAFMGYAGVTSASGQYSTSQLWNPAGSGKRLVVEQISINCDNSAPVVISNGTVQCLNKRTNGISKRLGYANGKGECRYESRATRQVDGYVAVFCQAGSTVNFKPTEPFVIEPGNGLEVFFSGAIVATVTASYEWFEEEL